MTKYKIIVEFEHEASSEGHAKMVIASFLAGKGVPPERYVGIEAYRV